MMYLNPVISSTTALSLSHYLSSVQTIIDEVFDDHAWVVAEIRNATTKGGHHYFELAEKNSTGGVVASCRATLWKSKATSVINKFRQATGTLPQAGQNVLIKGNARFHPQYGFSFQIIDIDPSYTLGALAQAYQAMQQKLQEMGLTTLNKCLPMPFDIQQVIVIAPENAAGLGDFRADADRLQRTGACHFHYYHATFQGNHAADDIRAAIANAFRDFDARIGGLPDLLVIIRGGGAVGDLAYLNDYELAAMVAESPVPVWVGIGHERDKVILDDIAHTRFDTPSKVIAAITNHLRQLWQGAKHYQLTTLRHAQHLNDSYRQNSAHQHQHLQLHCHNLLQHLRHNSDSTMHQIKQGCARAIAYNRQNSQHLWTRHHIAQRHLEHWRMTLQYLQGIILNQHPKHILNKGYALVHDSCGRLVTTQTQALQAAQLTITLKDGQVQVLTTP